MKTEPTHRRLLPTCLDIEMPTTYGRLAAILDHVSYDRARPLEPQDQRRLAAVDRCLRFFYLCIVLDTLGVEQVAIVRQYYFYFLLIGDPEKRELHQYMRTYYPHLFAWLQYHRPFLRYFQETRVWKPTRWRAWRINRQRAGAKPSMPPLRRPVPVAESESPLVSGEVERSSDAYESLNISASDDGAEIIGNRAALKSIAEACARLSSLPADEEQPRKTEKYYRRVVDANPEREVSLRLVIIHTPDSQEPNRFFG
jgi:hypothetical protein